MVSHLTTVEVNLLHIAIILCYNDMVPYTRSNIVTSRHHVLVRIIVRCPTHSVERNLIRFMLRSMTLPLWTDSYPKVTPVVVWPLVMDRVLIDKVCTLTIMAELVCLEPESI